MENVIKQSTFLVLGATGGTGQHFVPLALSGGHRVRALVRTPTKLLLQDPSLQVVQGSITEELDIDRLLGGVDIVISMLGDAATQKSVKINTAFVKKLVPAMRRQGVKRFLYQAGGLSRPYGGHLSPVLWTIRNTVARSFIGQHEDNEAVMQVLAEEANDIEWMVHRAGIGGNGPSKGTLERSATKLSIATFKDCAAYNYRTVMDTNAIHTSDFSRYERNRISGS